MGNVRKFEIPDWLSPWFPDGKSRYVSNEEWERFSEEQKQFVRDNCHYLTFHVNSEKTKEEQDAYVAKRSAQRVRRLERKDFLKKNPGTTHLPPRLVPDRNVYTDVAPIGKPESTRRKKLIFLLLKLKFLFIFGCGHQGRLNCKFEACNVRVRNFLCEMKSERFKAAATAGNLESLVETAANRLLSDYEHDHFFSWLKTANFYSITSMKEFLLECTR